MTPPSASPTSPNSADPSTARMTEPTCRYHIRNSDNKYATHRKIGVGAVAGIDDIHSFADVDDAEEVGEQHTESASTPSSRLPHRQLLQHLPGKVVTCDFRSGFT
ncbi:hypothetical protein PsYK624_127250 [Phanerochaete sordida]|uniref:Uncharacterized protein n=1 Tax=Phanerochaete sordida TaxID=48140 RepID=A0A9P3GIG2_9APHY|nr:hypothetical protein PsYK624_127250 [Phanerochaete sordida]